MADDFLFTFGSVSGGYPAGMTGATNVDTPRLEEPPPACPDAGLPMPPRWRSGPRLPVRSLRRQRPSLRMPAVPVGNARDRPFH